MIGETGERKSAVATPDGKSRKKKKKIMKRANQEGNSIEELMFADDLVLQAEDTIRLQEMVSNLDQQSKNYGMRISRDKTEVMVTSKEPIQCDIELNEETLNTG